MKASVLTILVLGLVACTPAKSTPEAPKSTAATELTPKPVLVPAGFTGRWDASIEACKATSDLKLTITQSEMTFWESSGRITGVTINSPDDVTVKAAFSGEGEQWQRDLHLVLSDDGRTLTTDGTTRVRCS